MDEVSGLVLVVFFGFRVFLRVFLRECWYLGERLVIMKLFEI